MRSSNHEIYMTFEKPERPQGPGFPLGPDNGCDDGHVANLFLFIKLYK